MRKFDGAFTPITVSSAILVAGLFGLFAVIAIKHNHRLNQPPAAVIPPIELYGDKIADTLDRSKIEPFSKTQIDLDNDGIPDLAWMGGGQTVWWSKSGTGPDQALGAFSQPVFVYHFAQANGVSKIIFYSEDGQGYEAVCRGLDKNGLPYFGPVEERQ